MRGKGKDGEEGEELGRRTYHFPAIVRAYIPAPSCGIAVMLMADDDSAVRENAPVSSCSYDDTRTVYAPAEVSLGHVYLVSG